MDSRLADKLSGSVNPKMSQASKHEDTVSALKQKIGSGVVALVIAVALLIAGFAFNTTSSADARVLDSEGVTVEGTVTEVNQNRVRGRTLTGQYYVRADFIVDGRQYQATSTSDASYVMTKPGDVINVVYSPSDPELNYAGDENFHAKNSNGGVVLIWLGGGLLIMFSAMLINYIVRLKKLNV